MIGKLILKDGQVWQGESFGANKSIAGEVVFVTGMVGYPESLTDPSYRGQILVMTYPLVGNYGIPDKATWESGKIQISALIVCNYVDSPSHFLSKQTLAKWLKSERVPALEIKDTRGLTLRLRSKGCILGKVIIKGETDFQDSNLRNLAAEVSIKRARTIGRGKKTVIVIDCGVKQNIIRELLKRNVKVIQAPWDFNPFKAKIKFDGLLISNGPGDPKICKETIATVKISMGKQKPILGICLGNQILALAAGGDTAKMKFGHRGQNQPVSLVGSKKCYLTTQNHGFEVKKVPKGFRPWFVNLNDATNEGIIHQSKKFMSVQFHPESCPGPVDTGWVFDEFVSKLKA